MLIKSKTYSLLRVHKQLKKIYNKYLCIFRERERKKREKYIKAIKYNHIIQQ